MASALHDLDAFQPRHDFFIGIDSDGCVFDTMEVKHKECFIPNIIGSYRLAAVSKYAREVAEFVNLYSVDRGINRFLALVKTFDLLAQRPEVLRRGIQLDSLSGLRDWIGRETKLGNPTLIVEVDRTSDPDLKQALTWSQAVNETVGQIVHGVPPFPLVRESLERLADQADVVVVSATPNEALAREWQEHGLASFVRLIAGQEVGSKADVLAKAAASYPREKTLMIGDAPGDRKAADKNQIPFFPINPGHEDQSWDEFHRNAIDRWFDQTYQGDYQDHLVERFESLLPVQPSWPTT